MLCEASSTLVDFLWDKLQRIQFEQISKFNWNSNIDLIFYF